MEIFLYYLKFPLFIVKTGDKSYMKETNTSIKKGANAKNDKPSDAT